MRWGEKKQNDSVKLLVIGDTNSVWNKYYLLQFVDEGFELSMMPVSMLIDTAKEFYDKHRINLLDYSQKDKMLYRKENKNILEKIYLGFKIYLHLLLNRDYDIVCLQYVDVFILQFMKFLFKNHSKLIVSYWGGDLLDVPRGVISKMEGLVKQASYVTFDNADLEEKFNLEFEGMNLPRRVVMLPLPTIDLIEKVRNDFNQHGKKNIEIDGKIIDLSKVVISIGYNAKMQQQHLKVIEQINRLPGEMKSNIVLVIQMTYAYADSSNEYINKVKNEAISTGTECVFFERFLSEEDVVKIRLATDIYINAQTIDAFSGSVCEYLYADTILVNAQWLHYKEFDQYPFSFLEFQSFDEIPKILTDVIDKNNKKIDFEVNRKLVWDLRSMNMCSENWKQVFSEVMSS